MSATGAAASWVTRDLNMRAGPGTHHHVRAVLPRCAHIRIHHHRGGWSQVSWHGHRGWVSARYLSRHRPHHCGGHHYRPHRQPQHPYYPRDRHHRRY